MFVKSFECESSHWKLGYCRRSSFGVHFVLLVLVSHGLNTQGVLESLVIVRLAIDVCIMIVMLFGDRIKWLVTFGSSSWPFSLKILFVFFRPFLWNHNTREYQTLPIYNKVKANRSKLPSLVIIDFINIIFSNMILANNTLFVPWYMSSGQVQNAILQDPSLSNFRHVAKSPRSIKA